MRFFKDKNYRKIAIVISIPVLLIAQYYLFKIGVFKPMVKGVEVSMVEGDYIKDLDKFVIKLDEEVTLSSGNYITIPSYSKEPKIWFKELDEGDILKIEGNKIIGLKEGISSVGIMKDSRVLKKINIKVVQQKVKDLEATSEEIKYVGESTEIETVIQVAYDRFKESSPVTYTSTDESVLQVVGNKINAIGVGKASVLVKSGDVEKELSYNIKAKIASIKIDKVIELGIKKTKKLEPEIITTPSGLEYGKVKYELVENKMPIQRAIAIDYDNGTITGIHEGEEKVKISCGNKSTIITVKVIGDEPSQENNKIENLDVDYEVVDNKIIISLVWDYLNNINEYGVYVKNNSLQDKEYNLFSKVNVKSDEISDSKKVKTTIELDLIDGKIPDLSIYVVGMTKSGNTEHSNIVNIKPKLDDDIVNETVDNLIGSIDDQNNIKLVWNSLNIPDVTYSIYIKDNLNGESGFVLYQNGIQVTEYIIPIITDNLDLEVYIVGNQNDKNSNPSNIVQIKK